MILSRSSQYRLALLLSMIVVVPCGYAIRFTQLPHLSWLSDFLGGVFYEVFWILFVLFLLPKASLKWTAIGVCLASCALEVLQLWQPPFLQAIRATLPGRLVLGNTFVWSDFWQYFLGSGVGWFWAKAVRSRFYQR